MYKKSVAIILIPLFLGTILYYLFCPNTFFVIYIDKLIGRGFHFNIDLNNYVIKILRSYLFDFLWAYALMETIILLIRPQKVELFIYFIVVALFEILMECIQMSDKVRGTFDVYDILLEIIVNVFVLLIYIVANTTFVSKKDDKKY